MQGQIYDILTQASCESLPAPSGHTYSHTLHTYIWGGGGERALILDRCRAFDLFVSVDAHLWCVPPAFGAGEDILAGWRGGGGVGGQYFGRRHADTVLYSTYVSTLWI